MPQISYRIGAANAVGNAVTSDLLGSNTLFRDRQLIDSHGNTGETAEVLASVGVTTLRYPGGTMTEEFLTQPIQMRRQGRMLSPPATRQMIFCHFLIS